MSGTEHPHPNPQKGTTSLMTATLNEITTDRTTKEETAKREADTRARMLDMLTASASTLATESTGLAYHPKQGNAPLVSVRQGEDPAKVAQWLVSHVAAEEAEAVFQLPPTIKCRPWDGAVNVNDLLRQMYGMASQGLPIHTMFGTRPPQEISVEVGFNEHRSIPFGLINLPVFEGEMYLGQKEDPVYGILFDAYIKAPKKFKTAIDGFWNQVSDRIKKHSIYKGAALVGVGKTNAQGEFEHPTFLNPYGVDPNKVAYNEETFQSIRASVWGPIRTAKLQRAAGLKLNRKSLLFGSYGGGKSLAGSLTARTAVNNGWTFIQAKTNDEDLAKVLKTAELYAPAVVFIEDIDILIDSDPKEMSRLLEMFDGVSSKDKEVMVLMTSNHIDALSKGMTRVGRIDSAIEIGQLDTEAIRRLITANFEKLEPYNNHEDHGIFEAMSKEIGPDDLRLPQGSWLADDIDFEAIYESMKDYEAAFIMGTFNLAKSNAIVRTESLNFRLTTEDFVIAANTLRNQHDTHRNAADRPSVESVGVALESIMRSAAREVIQDHRVDFRGNGDIIALPSS